MPGRLGVSGATQHDRVIHERIVPRRRGNHERGDIGATDRGGQAITIDRFRTTKLDHRASASPGERQASRVSSHANLASMPARSRYATATFPVLTRRCTDQVNCEKLSATPPALTTTTRLTLRFSMARVSTDATRVVRSGGDSSFANGLLPARRRPMHETTASCSSIAFSRNAGSVTSPRRTTRFRRPVSRLFSSLTTAVTEWPASAATATTHWPTPPDAPRTTSRMTTNLEVATRQTRALHIERPDLRRAGRPVDAARKNSGSFRRSVGTAETVSGCTTR